MLKTARYQNCRGEFLAVAYKMYGDTCVFSSLDEAIQGSSINFAEAIALSICIAEGRFIASTQFFDLQTRGSYSVEITKLNPGDFEFDQVFFEPSDSHEGGWCANKWLPYICPPAVIDDFSSLIDGTPNQVRPPLSV